MRTILVRSFTTQGLSYRVGPRGAEDSDLACDCPAFRRTRPCKHVNVYIAVARAVKRCLAAGHQDQTRRAEGGDWVTRPDADTICATCLAAVLVASAHRVQSRTRSALADLRLRLKMKRQKKETDR